MAAKKKAKKGRRGYKLRSGEFKWKSWSGAKCPNIHCRSPRRCYTPTGRGHFAFYEVQCFDCGGVQFMDVNFRSVRPPEGWTRSSEGHWLSPGDQAKEGERRLKMAAKKKKKAKKKAKKKGAKKNAGDGVRQVVYFSVDNAAVHKAAKKYAEEQEQSFASVVVEALTSYLELG